MVQLLRAGSKFFFFFWVWNTEVYKKDLRQLGSVIYFLTELAMSFQKWNFQVLFKNQSSF